MRSTQYVCAIAEDSPEAVSAAFADAMRERDLPGAISFWLEDAVMVQADGHTLHGRDVVAGALGALIDNDVTVDISLERVIASGDVAVGVGALTLSGADGDGNGYRQSSRSVVIYARAPDGRWRLAIDAPWGLPQS